jgi:hypothetical protein
MRCNITCIHRHGMWMDVYRYEDGSIRIRKVPDLRPHE